MYIKKDKKYATHPSLEVEIPIFDSDKLPEGVNPQSLYLCEIDVRRDRRKGLFRYHVTKVQESL